MLNTRWSCIGIMSEFSMKTNDSRRVRTLPVHLETVFFCYFNINKYPKKVGRKQEKHAFRYILCCQSLLFAFQETAFCGVRCRLLPCYS